MSRRFSLSSKFPLSYFLSEEDDGFYFNVQDDDPCSSSTPLSNASSTSPYVVSHSITVAAPETNHALSQSFPPETPGRTHVATLGSLPVPRLVSTGIDPRLFAKNESGRFAVNVFEYSVTFEASPLINTQLENPSYNPTLTASVTYGHWYIYPRYRMNFFLSLRSQALGFSNGLYAVGYMALIRDRFDDFEPAVHSIGNFHYWRRNTMFGCTNSRGGTLYDGKDITDDILDASGGEYETVSSSIPPTRSRQSKQAAQHVKGKGKGKLHNCNFQRIYT
ncbi:hypothetical protein EMPS_02698 [Entomortierella parvispora]|uniref:Uncharacterized protein n=1 Tax=Entomortierella parvispora TaxID=205924 RepID=A0A9P3H579_9FUNG|nr:hypothetical protein EMPS_02698 [Entomortierella parvispora]